MHLLLLIALLFGASDPVRAQSANQRAVGARPAALGQAFVAVADDGQAAYWNPAGLPALRSQEIHTSTANLFGAGLNSNYLSYALPLTDRYAAGVDWLHLGFDDGELSLAQNRIGFASGLRLSQRLAVGASAKWFNVDAGLEGLAAPEGFSSEGTGWGFDIGLLAELRPGFKVGIVAQDLGDTQIEYANGIDRTIHPANWRLGAAWRPNSALLLSGGADEAAHLGAEYRLHPALTLRGGLQRDLEEAPGTAYAFGAGVHYRFVQVDYAYTAAPGLDGTHRFSLGLAFDLSTSAIEIREPELQPIFPALQKRYNERAVGQVKLTNTSRQPLAARLSLFIPETMEQPTQQEAVVLAPGTETVDLFALFGGQLAEWPRNRMLPAEIQVSYSDGGRTRRSRKQGRVTIYKRNAVQWQDIGAAAAFITPDDEAVATFASGVLHNFDVEIAAGGRASRPLLRAMVLFDALGHYGVRYLADANTPYEQIAGRDFIVDSIQYPAELLHKRAGDCDDCTALYCSLLENAGISTALIDAPGHILMAFDTGVDRYEAQQLGLDQSLYLERDGQLWLPVEVTLFGQSFHQAWRTAVEECLRLAAEDRLLVVDTRSAWRHYPPSPPNLKIPVEIPQKEGITPLFDADRDHLRTLRDVFLNRAYLDELAVAPDNYPLYSAFVYNLLQLGEYDRALAHLATLEERGAPLRMVWNNRAVVYILQGEFKSASAALQEVLAVDPQDREALANLQYVHSQMGKVPVATRTSVETPESGERGEAVELQLEDLGWK